MERSVVKSNIEKLDFIIDGIKQGKYSLFLGAGISCDGFDANGKKMRKLLEDEI